MDKWMIMTSPLPFHCFGVILVLLCLVNSSFSREYYLNTTVANNLCSNGCAFTNPAIWQGNAPPVNGSDVHLVGATSITINISTTVVLNSLIIRGKDVAVEVFFSPLFQVSSYLFIDNTNLQVESATVVVGNLTLFSGALLVGNLMDLSVGYFNSSPSSNLFFSEVQFECGYCDLSTIEATNTTIIADEIHFHAETIIEGDMRISVLEAKSDSVQLTSDNYMIIDKLLIATDANVMTSGPVEITQAYISELASLFIINSPAAVVAFNESSVWGAEGSSIMFRDCNFAMGNLDVHTDLTSMVVQLEKDNSGVFTNIALGSFMMDVPSTTVEIQLIDVTLTMAAIFYANLTVYTGLTLSSLTVMGNMTCLNTAVIISEQLLVAYTYIHTGGQIAMTGTLGADDLFIQGAVLNTYATSRIEADLVIYNSSIAVGNTLYVDGNWWSSSTSVALKTLQGGAAPRLNISGDVYANNTVIYCSILSVPSEVTVYNLISYYGTLNGTFEVNYSESSEDINVALLTVQYTATLVTVTYTPTNSSGSGSILSPGPVLWGILGGCVLVVLFVLIGSWYAIKRNKERQYEIIQDR